MFLRKLRLLAEIVGFIVITLLCLYGGMAFFANARLVFATVNDSSRSLVSHAAANEKVAFAPLTTNPQQISNPSSVVPPFLNYQGALRNQDGIPLPDAQYTMIFRIYDDNNSVTKPIGTEIWSEQIFGVTVRDGRFGVLLGNTSPIPTDLFLRRDRFLGVQIEGHDEMKPRQRFSSVPYAMAADQAYGLSAANGGPRNIIAVNGNGGVEIVQDPQFIDISDVELSIFGGEQSNLLLQNSNNQWGRIDRWAESFDIHASDEVHLYTDRPNGKVIIGSIIVDNQGNLGNPDRSTTLNLYGSRIGDTGDYRLFMRSGGDIITFDGENDRVGIGTADPDPQAKLDVNGTLRVAGEMKFRRRYLTFNAHAAGTQTTNVTLGTHDICMLTKVDMSFIESYIGEEHRDFSYRSDGSCQVAFSYGPAMIASMNIQGGFGHPSWYLTAEPQGVGVACSAICMDFGQ